MHVCICLCLFVQCSLSKSRLSPEVEAFITLCPWASLVAQLVKNPPTRQKTWVWSLGWEDPLEKGTATHSSILTWRILWAVQSMGSQRVGHEWAIFTFTAVWRKVSGDQGGNMRQRWCPAGEVLKRRRLEMRKTTVKENKVCIIKEHQYVWSPTYTEGICMFTDRYIKRWVTKVLVVINRLVDFRLVLVSYIFLEFEFFELFILSESEKNDCF